MFFDEEARPGAMDDCRHWPFGRLSAVVYTGFRGWGDPGSNGSTFLHWRKQNFGCFQTRKLSKNV